MKLLILDNYDSFTYNLVHYAEQFVNQVDVYRNDEIDLIETDEYSHILISPGPGLPAKAGITMDIFKRHFESKAILGVCLGCQAMAEFFGGKLYNQNKVAHGLQRKVRKTSYAGRILKDMPDEFEVGLYHSWAIDAASLPSEIKVTALSQENVVMTIEHKDLPLAGVQFHPESVMTPSGISIIKNWLKPIAENRQYHADAEL